MQGHFQSLKQGNNYIIEIINPIKYASFIEYGHRTRNHKGWVKGRYMMTISVQELQRSSRCNNRKEINKFIKEGI
ncbi:HK97 gp10 family phage protein|uniref:HK97 gp10 family phage protein n=1 Tax=Clostridioides difficile TaxID=1496 RepID=UPI003558B854